ncbi:hypothetical protein [Psychrobacter sp.]|uniref:hypothetical protein n=1 Tax=Psychrobacter sp. TaxID=56811 RepID=UPI002647816A|nr:hypothetical protein [Psychrobacter sp.]MDN6275566.1 hypothetical protein [Psychrobacter sp.]MDN6308213.1 hypothetical protein [Psychrobacter sp.]
MKYTAIIKDGGLFIPNVFSDLNDGGAHIVQVEIDLEEVRQQLSKSEILETAVTKKSVAKDSKKSTAKTPTTKPSTAKLSTAKTPKKEVQKEAAKKLEQEAKTAKTMADNTGIDSKRQSAIDELESLDDSELSEIFKAYMNNGQAPAQISLDNL